MHQPRAQAHPPQRSRAHLVSGAADTVDRKLPPHDLVDGRPIVFRHCHDDPVAGVAASTVSRAGALVARRKRVNRSISASPEESVVLFGSDAVLHSVVTSSGSNRLVMPISFK